MHTRPDEHDLAEIKALTADLGRSTQLVLKRVKRARGVLRAEGPLMAFVHIPKTAGQTVTGMFARAYSKAALDDAGNYMRGSEKATQKVIRRPGGWERWHHRGGRVTAGHVPYHVFREHLPEDTRYMTFLRDPVDRVLSHYYRHMHRPELSSADQAERRQQGRATAVSLEQALGEQRLPQLINLATRFLCAQPLRMDEELPAGALDEAKANLRDFTFVGIQERFEESIVLLQRTLGLGLVPYTNRHVSVEGGRPSVEDITDEQRALIAEHNRLDAELYSFGLELFDDAVAASDDGFAAEVEELRTMSADTNEDAIQQTREWLDRELPVGATRKPPALRSAAKSAGVSISVLRVMLRTLPSVQAEFDRDGEKIFRRTGDAEEPTRHDRTNGAGPSSA